MTESQVYIAYIVCMVMNWPGGFLDYQALALTWKNHIVPMYCIHMDALNFSFAISCLDLYQTW